MMGTRPSLTYAASGLDKCRLYMMGSRRAWAWPCPFCRGFLQDTHDSNSQLTASFDFTGLGDPKIQESRASELHLVAGPREDLQIHLYRRKRGLALSSQSSWEAHRIGKGEGLLIFQSEAFCLRTGPTSARICHWCSSEDCPYNMSTSGQLWGLQEWHRFDLQAPWREGRPGPPPYKHHHPFWDVPGCKDPMRIKPDIAHSFHIHGVGVHFAASTIVWLAKLSVFGQFAKFNHALRAAYSNYMRYCDATGRFTACGEWSQRHFKMDSKLVRKYWSGNAAGLKLRAHITSSVVFESHSCVSQTSYMAQ